MYRADVEKKDLYEKLRGRKPLEKDEHRLGLEDEDGICCGGGKVAGMVVFAWLSSPSTAG